MHLSILKTQGPCLILAGAGTGKTYTIVEKIKFLISEKIYDPEKILCLTFSNEATNSLRTKILPHVKEKEPIIRTFHSFCSDLLKKHGENIGLKKFNILLPDDAKILLHKNFKITPYYCNLYVSEIGIAKDLGIQTQDLENYVKSKTQAVPILREELEKELENAKFQLHTFPSNSKNPKNPVELLKEKINRLEKLLKYSQFLQAWKSYEKLKSLKGLLDYSDLNLLALKLLKENQEISNEFDYIIVDEFQDTNKLQCDLLEFLSPKKNITVVGDQNQSIYRFRGAYKDNISNFKKAFEIKTEDIFTLDKSYRSTNKILDIAHKLIRNNYENKEDCFEVVSASNQEGENPRVFQLEDNKEEVRKIVEIIKQELKKGTPENEICVMFRTHQQSNLLKNYLDYKNIPYTSIVKKSLLKLGLIKKIRAYLTILNNISGKTKGSDRAWWDLIHHSEFPKPDEITLGSFIKKNQEDKLLSIKILNSPDFELSDMGSLKLKLIIKSLKELISKKNSKVSEKITQISNILQTSKEDFLVLQKFHTLAKEYEEIESQSLPDFLYHLNIIDSLGIDIQSPEINNSGIRIMTSHATKGLEYRCVIFANLAQKKFPIENFSKSLIPSEISPELKPRISGLSEDDVLVLTKKYDQENQLLEERRLCYVSFTRAKSNLYITYAKKYGARSFYPSQFLTEINYKENPGISFSKDSEIKYKTPEKKIISAKIIGEKTIFSPSSLQCFDECQKKYEYKYIYKMPDKAPESWNAIHLGSFIHKVLEKGVRANLKEEKPFLDLAKCLSLEEKWQSIDLSEAFPLIKIFFHRNKEKFGSNSKTEFYLKTEIEGLDFQGYADRIDFSSSGEIEIIDYKTGKFSPKPKYRNWQLGFYALAAQSIGEPKKLTLEMLQKENPIEFHVDKKGNAKEIHSIRTEFNLEEIKSELIGTARKIIKAKVSGFLPCSVEKSCAFCEEWIY
jgi:DNA helicase II / ATP-dependent DNA helicase PcrA